MGDRFRFGEFEFDVDCGELRRLDGTEDQRMPPRPARLLRLLLERRGAIVAREEIHERLWPDTDDFDPGLHVCVRQIRAALDDPADDPRYLQDVPSCGYRFLEPVRRLDPARPPAPPWIMALAIAAGAAVTLLAL